MRYIYPKSFEMQRLHILLPLALAVSGLSAQDLHVYYDAFTDSVYYQRGGKPIDRPVVRKGENVLFHITNYNNYLYDAAVKTEVGQVSVSEGSAFNLGQLMPGGSFNPAQLAFGDGKSGGTGFPGIMVAEGSGMGDSPAEEKRRAQLVAEMRELESKITDGFELLTGWDTEMNEMNTKMQTALEAQQIQSFVAIEIQNLRYNPQLAPRQIKQLSQEYMSRIFDESDPKKLDLSAVIKKTDARGQLSGLQQEYETYTAQYAGKVDELKGLLVAIQDPKFDFTGNTIGTFRAVANKKIKNPEQNLATYQQNIAMLEAKLPEIKSLDLETLAHLRTDYLIIQENDFSKTYRHTAEGDNLSLQLILTPIDSVKTPGAVTKQVAPIQLSVYGGFQINASLGLNFGQFFQRPKDYFVRDSIISSSSKDAFTPYLTSSVHFYRQGRGSVSFGGSFGVGIPLGDGGGLESLAFFLGPSLVLGRGERIVFSAGLLGGKVQHLSDGYSEGDLFEADASLLKTAPRYELGYFVGLSFNLLGSGK